MIVQVLSGIALILITVVGWKVYRGYQYNQAVKRADVRIQQEAERQRQYEIREQQLAYAMRASVLDFHRVKTQGLQVAIVQGADYKVHDGVLEVKYPIAPRVQVTEEKQVEAPPAALTIPGRYDMREIWNSGFRPSTNQIWLAKGATDGIIVPANKLLHSIATGPTGGGKTNIVRMELMQLIYIGCEVTLMDIHYAPIKTDEDGNPIDWRPIASRLAQPPIYHMKAIIKWMHWLAYTELEGRITRQRGGQAIGKPIFFTIAELPAVLDEAGDDIADPLAKILRQGRQYGIFFVGDSQDLLTKTLHMTTGPRESFRTGFYTGGDFTTAKALLDLPNGVKISEEGLGQHGLVYLKTAVHPYTQARVGWASNESLYDLFQTPMSERIGYSHPNIVNSQVVPHQFPGGSQVVPETDTESRFPADGKQPEVDSEKLAAVREMLKNQKSQNDIVTAVFPGMRNADAIVEYRKLVSLLV
jgi:hypothetical protein